MFPPFPEELARIEAEKLMSELDDGLLFSLGIVKQENELLSPGQMFGVAVCIPSFEDSSSVDYSEGCSDCERPEKIVLRSFSGQLAGNGRWLVEGFVPPCIDVVAWKTEVERADPEIKELTEKISLMNDCAEKTELIAKRKNLSNESLRRIYGMYSFTCWDKHIETYETLALSLKGVSQNEQNANIFSIPTGTGDCCGAKMINYAFRNNLKIISMTEFFYGTEPRSGQKKHKSFYPPCDEKCGIVLPKMLGLEIIYRDESIIVVNKSSGLLSVPGRGEEKFDSVATRVRALFPDCIKQPTAHRLDMDTSGLMVLGLTEQAQRNLSMQFEARTVKKKYRALLRGKLSEKFGLQKSGTIEIKQRLDIGNRPHQIEDNENGKLAVTDWQVLDEWESENGEDRTYVEFCPKTGRTHQLRLASSHPKGLGIPIVGDNLYGVQYAGERLCLQAFYLEFEHPTTGERLKFTLPCDF